MVLTITYEIVIIQPSLEEGARYVDIRTEFCMGMEMRMRCMGMVRCARMIASLVP